MSVVALSRSGEQVPSLTAQVARASNPVGTTAMRVRDRLDGLWCDEDFAGWYPRDGLWGVKSPAGALTRPRSSSWILYPPGWVLLGEARDEGGEFLGDLWASDPDRFLLPFASEQAAVPGQVGARGDEAVAAQVAWEVSGEGGQHRAIRPRQAWPAAELPTQHRDLVALYEELNVRGVLRPRQQHEQAEPPDEDQVEHAQRHAAGARHDHVKSGRA
ncbi:hypothetical protein [Streptomyces sp. NBC_01198]|uniref:hypothetical protein n=1 Tax=Streptomyces sp. NBC_01198 TaxID=2903769 RepID=UPI002E156AD9|nr:hypothetical protein OG702_06920 [Streptomyces sp. NBC_01198]